MADAGFARGVGIDYRDAVGGLGFGALLRLRGAAYETVHIVQS